MSVGWRAGSSVTQASSTTTTVLPTPLGMFTADCMIACVCNIGVTPSVTAPDGWTLAQDFTHASGNMRSMIFYKSPSTNEPASYTFTWSSGGRNLGFIGVYSGVDLSIAPAVAVAETTGSSAGPYTTPSLTLNADDWLISIALGRESPGTASAISWSTNDASDVERHELTALNTGTSVQLGGAYYDSNRALTAGSHNRQISPNKNVSQTTTWSIRLRPLVVTPPATGGWSFGLPIR